MNTMHDSRYTKIIESLREIRRRQNITQSELAQRLGQHQSYIAKVEGLERRLDILELLDWLDALHYDRQQFFFELGWIDQLKERNINTPVPIRGVVEEAEKGIFLILAWQDQKFKVFLEGITSEQYNKVEQKISQLFGKLNHSKAMKNREAIAQALEYAVNELPRLNPSDIYQHIIYRLYLREYKKSKPEQSWVRAGGEAMELFIEQRYRDILAENNVSLKALLSREAKADALQQMGLAGLVGDSKLDLVLVGNHNGRNIVFGGVHSKASLAERVSDDVPCSRAMMQKGYASILYTFDSKSFPPPHGDLVNRGELGSHDFPSDKRRYIEDHGDFDTCFSYNLRTNPSIHPTRSSKRIYVSSLERDVDLFPKYVIERWFNFKSKL
ncbi:BsaWI family type II restriction enzyme [Candidatus Viridilinea mediisalina]|uniref:BsaWI family type II restriction enzyme n=1 Tax=Candidatus Viridilinea mediisalina TaxID=2024553 RepID=UPI001C2BA24F|nr:BsaWI family type II restriction enzyme [Candidatus Viridilinea mediisalina]